MTLGDGPRGIDRSAVDDDDLSAAAGNGAKSRRKAVGGIKGRDDDAKVRVLVGVHDRPRINQPSGFGRSLSFL